MANENGWGDGSVNNAIGWGQGANNAISWGKSHLDSWSGATDIDGGNAPINTVAPALSGTAQEGQTLTCSTGTWSGSPTYTYQWKRNGNNIGSATNSTYILVTADVGQSIKCTVTATNFSGSANADSNTVTPTSAVDPDAQAFITAASITDPTQQSAINNLVIGLKADGLWTKMKAIYPFVGGTSTTTSYNLRNTAQYQLSWNGGWTWNSQGVTGNGSNSFANTGFNPNSAFTTNDSAHLSIYSRTNSAASAYVDFGATNGLGNSTAINSAYANNAVSLLHNGSTGVNVTNLNTQGFYIGTRSTASIHKMFKNGSQLGTTDTTSSGTRPNFILYLGAYNSNGSNLYHTNRNYAFASIGDGLTDADVTNLNTRVTTFQTALNRNV